MAAQTTQKNQPVSKSADLEVHSHAPGDERPREEQHRAEREHLHDLVRPLLGARDEHVERADDGVAAVPGGLHDVLEPSRERSEALGVVGARDRIELRARKREKHHAVRYERPA